MFIYLFIYLFIYSFIHLPFVDNLKIALTNTSQPTYKSHDKNDKIRNVKNETKLKSETSFYQKIVLILNIALFDGGNISVSMGNSGSANLY